MKSLSHTMPRAALLSALLLLLAVGESRASMGGPDGDVLRPARLSSSGLVWHLGLDAGLTYSMFGGGPISIISQNPYWSQYTLAEQLANRIGQVYPNVDPYLPLESTIDDGSGLGFVIGATVDLSLSKIVGLTLRLNYHTRSASFEETTNTGWIHPGTTSGQPSIFKDEIDWTLNYFGVDLLARIQLMEDSWYLLVGPSYGNLLSNKAKLTQTIVGPDDIYYTEPGLTNPVERQLKTASNESEIEGLEASRFDFKAGFGTWIPLSTDLFLTPEITVAFPLTKIVKNLEGTTRINPPFTENKAGWNATTIFATVGLRWRMR